MIMLVAFAKEFADAHPVVEAEAVFDLEQAGAWHRQDPRFSLNTCDAFATDDGRVAVPVEGCGSVAELQMLSKVRLSKINR